MHHAAMLALVPSRGSQPRESAQGLGLGLVERLITLLYLLRRAFPGGSLLGRRGFLQARF